MEQAGADAVELNLSCPYSAHLTDNLSALPVISMNLIKIRRSNALPHIPFLYNFLFNHLNHAINIPESSFNPPILLPHQFSHPFILNSLNPVLFRLFPPSVLIRDCCFVSGFGFVYSVG